MRLHETKPFMGNDDYTLDELLDYYINYDLVVEWIDVRNPRWYRQTGESRVYCDDIEQARQLQELVESWGSIEPDNISIHGTHAIDDWDGFEDDCKRALDWRNDEDTAELYERYLNERHLHSEYSHDPAELMFFREADEWFKEKGIERW